MYRIKRITKLFGLTESNKYKNWEKINNEMISDVVIDDINDHTYKRVTYEGLLRRTQIDPETGKTIVENQPSFKYRHRSKQYSDEENEK